METAKTTSFRQSHFAPAFFFLNRKKRRALALLYEVCRILDDAVDEGHENPSLFLSAWDDVFSRKDSSSVKAFSQEQLAQEFLEMAENLGLPLTIMQDLIHKGVAEDLNKKRFETPMDLERYCYGVAGTVGVACLPIFGVPVDEGKNFAIRLGIAVQWINTIRDVGVDAAMGRIYLPLEHLEQFGYTEQDLLNRRSSPQFIQLMNYEASVARSHYKRALELLPLNRKTSLIPARIMGRIYLDLLQKIEKKGFPVLDKKIKLNFFEKLKATGKTLLE